MQELSVPDTAGIQGEGVRVVAIGKQAGIHFFLGLRTVFTLEFRGQPFHTALRGVALSHPQKLVCWDPGDTLAVRRFSSIQISMGPRMSALKSRHWNPTPPLWSSANMQAKTCRQPKHAPSLNALLAAQP